MHEYVPVFIPDDGYADGGEPYSDEEMEQMECSVCGEAKSSKNHYLRVMICGRCGAKALVISEKPFAYNKSVNCFWAGHKPEDFVTPEQWREIQRQEQYG